ncbi:MAG TPA: UvrD-helicase domain-containing protein, partial [Thermopolyspora sp.]
MLFTADLHIHSKYSRACSKDCDLEHLTWWARRKGITLVGTGDFTHPAWLDHLRDSLVPAEPGLFRLRDDLDRDIARTLPPGLATNTVRFMLSVEISTIYKRGDRTRKVHHLVYVPGFDAAAEFNRRLGRIGNLGSDGRPILGLDSRDLLEITLSCGDGAYLVPAHVWTPWFAVFGSKSGFDAIEECYVDLADHIFALETGLSSDPEMNWRVSALDRYRLISNSDAHSPPMLGREATRFDTDLDFFAVRRALETGAGHAGTIEFFPEEGKYHVDGHRKCGVRMKPRETREHGGVCPECGKPPTIGVLSRVEDLADRPEGVRPYGAAGFRNLVPLPEIMSEIVGTGPKSKRVLRAIDELTATLGAELAILQDVPVEDIEARSPLLAEAVRRLRRGEVIREAGYDGEYGVIRLFEPGELKRTTAKSTPALFEDSLFEKPSSGKSSPTRTKQKVKATEPEKPSRAIATKPRPPAAPVKITGSLLDGLDPDQRAAAEITDGPLLIIAGPGTGKTRTLTHRIAHLVAEHGVRPEHCLAITFTRRAAAEMTERLDALVPAHAAGLTVATFHSLGVRILRESHDRAGLSTSFGIADQDQQLTIAAGLAGGEKDARRLLAELSAHHRTGGPAPLELAAFAERYTKELRLRDLVDFDDLIALPVTLLTEDPELAAEYQDRYRWISVDEYQDVDAQQYRLLRLLAPPGGNLTAIGDPDQAIYRFRGADVGFFLRFQEDHPGARVVRLGRNYRSSATILTAASQLIAPTTLIPDRELWPMGDHGDALIRVHHAASEVAEASFIARAIEELLGGASFHSLDSGRVESDGGGGLGFSDFAVLYRTDRQARTLMGGLTRAGLP